MVRIIVIKRVEIGASIRATIGAHIAAMPRRETGGILLGHATEPGAIVVTKASPPGPRAVHRPFYFSRDTRFLQRWLDAEYDRTDGEEDYVGEWHVHRALDAGPSYVDRRSLWRIARKSNYATDEPVLLIVEDKPPERRFCTYGFEVKPKKRCAQAACL